MTPGVVISLVSLIVATLLASVAGTAYIVRNMGKQRVLVIETIRAHEHECANFEPNTAVQLRAVGEPPA